MEIKPNGIYIYHSGFEYHKTFYGLWSVDDKTFEAIPIGDHIWKPDIENRLPTYGRNNNFQITFSEFGIGKRLVCIFFDNGKWGWGSWALAADRD